MVINDRGPWIPDRVIDLSYAAARKLGMAKAGVAKVKLDVVKDLVGTASWYGRRFQGRTTASGEKYDMNKLTAAHRTLPFGTVVKVTNIENGKEVRVRINDRTSRSQKVLINLSRRAAEKLNMLKSGTARVTVSAIGVAVPK